MKKINIIRKTSEFETMLKQRNPYKTMFFNVYTNKNNLNLDRFGISVTKKTGNAVLRNKTKRRIKDIIDHYPEFTNNTDYLIITKPKIVDLSYIEIKENLTMILDKIRKENKNE